MTEPALTPEDWEQTQGNEVRRIEVAHELMQATLDRRGTDAVQGNVHHALAALALYGKSFGFTWDDVEMVRFLASHPNIDTLLGGDSVASQLASLADRLAALLPPQP